MERESTRWLLLAAAALWLLGMGVPATAQSPGGASFERLRAERQQAAEASLAEAMRPPQTESLVPAVLQGALEALPGDVPAWQEHLSPQVRRFLGQALEAEGAPAELLAVGWVESRFDAQALSPKGARGIWQLMPATARRYGLAVGGQRDDRTDLGLSTRAAGRYLSDLYNRFGDWPLALAAYNAGEQRLEAAIAGAGSRDFRRVQAWLPAETQAYVPAVLAAMGRTSAARAADQRRTGEQGRIVFADPVPGVREGGVE